MAAELRIRAMRETRDELQRFKACFDANGLPKHLDELEWRFLANPAGPLLVDFAIDAEGPDETVAAIYATMPVRAKLEREPCLAVQSLDTLTDSDYRGRGLFRKLADAAYEQLRARGVAFVYGFPNANSAHAFFERLGWSSLDPMPYLFRPLRLGYLLEKARVPRRMRAPIARLPIPVWRRRLGKDLEVRTVEQFDESFDRLWEDFASQIDVAVCRDREYLTWRLSERPGETYRTLGLYRESRLEGFVSFCHKRAESHHIGYVMELIYAPGGHAVGSALLGRALLELARDGCDVVLAWNFPHSPSRPAYRGCGFLPLPAALRGTELHMGVRALGAERADSLVDRRSWYISYCDSDTA